MSERTSCRRARISADEDGDTQTKLSGVESVGAHGPVRLMLLAIAVALFASIVGCASPEAEPQSTTGQDDQETPVARQDGSADGAEVLMMGRSVTEGLFQYWGWDWDGPVSHAGHTFDYHNLSDPPQIGEEAALRIREVPDGTTVFFKLCFVDFWAERRPLLLSSFIWPTTRGWRSEQLQWTTWSFSICTHCLQTPTARLAMSSP
jgi:hypothetical protein